MNRTKPIVLIGLMGAGKTAVARAIGARLGTAVAELDAEIERGAGIPVAAIFAREGEAAFRRREAAALRAALDRGAGVIDGGGGLVLDEANRELLASRCRVAWLEVAPGEAARRVAASGHARPLLAGADPERRLEALLGERRERYAAAAHARVTTDGRDVEAVAAEVLRALEGVG